MEIRISLDYSSIQLQQVIIIIHYSLLLLLLLLLLGLMNIHCTVPKALILMLLY